MVLDTLPLEFLQETMMAIHGDYCLPPGYMMVRLPIGAAVLPFHRVQHTACTAKPPTPRILGPFKRARRKASPANVSVDFPAGVSADCSVDVLADSSVDVSADPPVDVSIDSSVDVSKNALANVPPGRDLSGGDGKNKSIRKSSLSTRRNSEIACTYSALHSVAGVGQILSAVASIYKAHVSGGQIATYGYAAYSLTVIPYALMTAVNLLALLLTPNYPAIYMIESSIMDEARRRGGLFGGTVGILDEVDCSCDPPVVPSDKNEPCAWEVKLKGSADDGKPSYQAHEIKTPTPDQPVISETTATGHIIFGPGDGLPKAWDHKTEKMRFMKFFEWLLVFYVVIIEDQFDELPGLRLYSRLRDRDLRDVKPSPYRVLYRVFKGKRAPMPETMLPRIGRFKYYPLTIMDRFMFVVSDILLVGVLASPYLIIYMLTGYNPEESAFSERFWLTTWLVFGQLAIAGRVMWAFVNRFMGDGLRRELKWGLVISVVCGVVWMVPAFGGFIVVAKMILKSETCRSI